MDARGEEGSSYHSLATALQDHGEVEVDLPALEPPRSQSTAAQRGSSVKRAAWGGWEEEDAGDAGQCCAARADDGATESTLVAARCYPVPFKRAGTGTQSPATSQDQDCHARQTGEGALAVRMAPSRTPRGAGADIASALRGRGPPTLKSSDFGGRTDGQTDEQFLSRSSPFRVTH